MSFKEKLESIIDYYQISQYAFAKKVDVDKAMISNYIVKGSNPSFTVVESILKACPEISSEWLMRENGPMLMGTNIQEESKTDASEIVAELEKMKAELEEERELNKALQRKLLQLI